MKSAILALSFLFALASTGETRTWRVNTAGTGDAPDLYAAMDSAEVFDVVLVEAGQYLLHTALRVPRDVRLVGESGPAYTLLYRDESLAPGTVELSAGSSISGIHVRGNTQFVLFLHDAAADHCIVEALLHTTVVGGEGLGVPHLDNCLLIGGQIAVPSYFVECIIFSDLGSYAVGSTVALCDVLGEVDPAIDASSFNLNFSLDPQFCGIPGSGNYFLRSTSPCLPGNNPYGSPGLTGPLGAGCGAVSVQSSTWGAVKALYRNQ